MQTTRREFMKQSAVLMGAAGVGALSPEWLHAQAEAARRQPPTLVVLYLRGGADPINTFIPFGDPLYYSIRPTIAVPASQVIRLDNRFGFHPAMPELAELFRENLMAPVICAGSTHPTRSHFDAQDFMERAAPGIKSVTEGWLNRFLTATKTSDDQELRAVALQPTLPRSLRGEYPVLAVPTYGADHAMRVFESLYGCDSEKEAVAASAPGGGAAEPADHMDRVLEAGSTGIVKLRRLNEIIRRDDLTAAAYPNSHLGRQFRDVARLIKADVGMQITAIDYNGWDHHAYQGAVQGAFGQMLGEVSRSIASFVTDLGPRIEKTVVLVMTEFGRTVRENGNNGTDHGRGGYMMAVGGPVNGGRFYGRWTGLERAQLYEGRDLPTHVDFRLVFAEVLETMFGFRAMRTGFFPEYRTRARPLGLLRPLT
jgi:uncharacterized protein (DUF1501 family)